jgi:hypothetical protein
MDTVCCKQLSFGSLFGKQINADLDGGHITSHAGGLLLRELDERMGSQMGLPTACISAVIPAGLSMI